jgi:glutamine cyclotransferase
VYDSASWKKLKELDWPHEGWGMTHDSTHLIISIGDSNLYFVNPEDFKLSNILAVSDNNGPVGNLNELEYANGYIYANQYLTNNILKINAQTGRVEARADLTNIMNANGVHFDAQNLEQNGGVLNGIAYNAQTNSFYVTGKLWPALFEIKLN